MKISRKTGSGMGKRLSSSKRRNSVYQNTDEPLKFSKLNKGDKSTSDYQKQTVSRLHAHGPNPGPQSEEFKILFGKGGIRVSKIEEICLFVVCWNFVFSQKLSKDISITQATPSYLNWVETTNFIGLSKWLSAQNRKPNYT